MSNKVVEGKFFHSRMPEKEIQWSTDAEKASFLTGKSELWTVTQGQRSNH